VIIGYDAQLEPPSPTLFSRWHRSITCGHGESPLVAGPSLPLNLEDTGTEVRSDYPQAVAAFGIRDNSGWPRRRGAFLSVARISATEVGFDSCRRRQR
jgi:hypothetical protein